MYNWSSFKWETDCQGFDQPKCLECGAPMKILRINENIMKLRCLWCYHEYLIDEATPQQNVMYLDMGNIKTTRYILVREGLFKNSEQRKKFKKIKIQ
jgi:hypothetical protein